MKIAQISDLHLTADKKEKAYDIDVWENLKTVFHDLSRRKYDILVISGDIAFREGNPDIYRQLREFLEVSVPPHVRVALMSGNHDSAAMLAAEFNMQGFLHGDELYYESQMDEAHLLFLDSTPKSVSQQQLEWAKEVCRRVSGYPLIFIHHPPFPAGLPYMDLNHGLEKHEELTDFFASCPRKPAVFSGHYHTERTIVTPKADLFLTPSTFYTIDPIAPQFKLGSYDFGYRFIELDSGQLNTQAIWFRGNPPQKN